jgi:two-component system, NarL family, response regulator NreC
MRVVLIDDHRVFLDSLRIAVTAREPGIQVVGQSAAGADAAELAARLAPDLMVVDLLLDGSDAVTVTRELRRRELATNVLVLSAHENKMFVRDTLAAGAQGYALKTQPLSEVIEAMKTVASGGRYLAPSLAPLPTDGARGPLRPGQLEPERLSRREREIFDLILQGRSSRDIGRELCISLKTVETHRAHINKKLGVRSPAELIRVAALQGLVGPAPRTH